MLSKSLEKSLSQDDILTGNNEWQNIQEIVRLTFKQLFFSISSQEKSLQNIERQLSLKASRSEVQTLVSQKTDLEEFHLEMNSLRALVQSIRTETSGLICANREDYISDYRKILSELDSKACKSDVISSLNEIGYQINLSAVDRKEIRKELENKIQALKSQVSMDIDYTREMNMIEFDKILENNKLIISEINKNKQQSEEAAAGLLGKIKSLKEESECNAQEMGKADEERYNSLSSAIGGLRNELFEEIKSLADDFSRLAKELEQTKAGKADSSHVFSLIQMKSDEISLLREELNFHSTQIKSKASYTEFDKESKNLKESLELAKREISYKYDKMINDIEDTLETKSEKAELGGFIEKQEAINETICSENTIARWIIGNKKQANGEVCWDQIKVNTCPDNFVWEESSADIHVVNAGCYEVCLAFYAEKKPFVQVLVNNQLAFSIVNCPSYSLNSSGNTGITINEFLALRENSIVKVLCEGQHISFAFISIKKV